MASNIPSSTFNERGDNLLPQTMSTTSDLQSGLDNPWISSPAVTTSHSELSTGSNDVATADDTGAESTPQTLVPVVGAAPAAVPAVHEEKAATTVEDEGTTTSIPNNPVCQQAQLNTQSAPTTPTTPTAPAIAMPSSQPTTTSVPPTQQQQTPQQPPSVQHASSVGLPVSPTTSPAQQAQPLAQSVCSPHIPNDGVVQIAQSNISVSVVAPTQNYSTNIHHMDTSFSEAKPQPAQIQQHSSSSPIAAEQEAMEDGMYQEGGRLWKAALKEAEKEKNNPKGNSKQRSRFAESIMERTRSRADPNALVSSTTSNAPGGKPSMVSLGDSEGSFILSTALAKKRVRVVQLLLIGLVGLLLGLLGNFFVSTSCHFATVNIMVGQNEKTFEFHFGLWKYSPIESVFQGYPYCYKYDQNYSDEAPILARVANIAALVAGLVAISILWLYLIFGYADKLRWTWAVRIAAVAGIVQLGTLYFFFGRICQEYECELGPGAYLAIFTSVVWFVLACEMHYHMPVAMYASGWKAPHTPGALEEPRSLVTTMEMTNIDEVTREYITRVTGKTKEDELPGLNTDLKRVRPKSGLYSPTSTNGSGLYFPSPRGTYQAPDPSLVEEALNGGASRQ